MLEILENIFHEIISDPVKYIYGVFQTMAYIYLCYFFMSNFLRRVNKENKHSILICFSTIIIEFLVSTFFINMVVVKILLNGIIMLLFLVLMFDAAFKQIILWYLMFLGLNLATECFVLELYKKVFSHMAEKHLTEGIAGSMLGILTQIILFMCIIIIRKLFGNKLDDRTIKLSDCDWIKFLLFPMFTIISIAIILVSFDTVQSRGQGQALLIISMGLCLMNVNVFSLLLDVVEKEKRIATNKMIQEKMRNQMEIYQVISDKYESQRKNIHEFRNHILCIAGLAGDGQYSELMKYIDKIEPEYTFVTEIFDTNNVYINTVINQKYSEAQEKDIVFLFKANDLATCPLVEKDAVILLSNLINNAFEACNGCEKRLIKVKIICENDRFLISVSNTYKNMPQIQNNRYLTSKPDTEEHGIGIGNIRDIVDKYNGTYVINIKKLFSFIIEIPLKMGV